MKQALDSDEDEELGAYQRKLREKANLSMQQLSSVLDRSSESQGVEDSQAHSDTDASVDEDSSHHFQVQESEAVSQLRSLLQKQPREAVNVTPSKRKPTPKRPPEEVKSDLPAMQDLVPIIHNQSDYIRQLEAEVKFCKEELLGMKQRVRVVIVENERLHEELKSKVVAETLRDHTILESTMNPVSQLGSPERTMKPKPMPRTLQPADEGRWRKELDQLRDLHQAQLQTLEAQVVALKKDLATAQRECEEVKGRLRHREAMMAASAGQPQVGGLCLRCAQHEAVLAETHTNVHTQTIERITKERDELMTVLCTQRASQAEAQQREWSFYQQVKQAVEMAEEANLEKTRAEVQCEQLRSELSRQRERLEQELEAQQQRISQARDTARHQANKEKDELAQTVGSLSQRVAELEGLMERSDREKTSLTGQLEEVYRKLTEQEADNSKVCGELRYLLSQAQLKREEAERQLKDTNAKHARQLELSQQEAERLGVELGECRRRLEEAQRAGSRAQAEAVGLEERLGRAEHQLHLTRQEKEVLERCRGEDVAALTFQWQQREFQLTQQLQQMDTQHERTVGEMDALLSSQNGLIVRLKEECRDLGQKLEEVTENSRLEVEQLTTEKAYLQESMEKLKTRCQDMEEQCVQHGRMHQRMKKRLQQLDQHCQSSAQQVMELLGKQNQLMQERQELAEEMQNLRINTQTPGAGKSDSSST